MGAGVNGLSTALLLAADGHDVTVLERDPEGPPSPAEVAWRGWERRGVNQFRMIHMFASRWRQIVDTELPEVARTLEAAGGLRANPLASIPGSFSGGWREGDEIFEMLTGRRPVVEAVLAQVAARTPGIDIRRGVAVAGLRLGEPSADGIPHVVGVRTTSGDDVDADLLVDTGGRRSPLVRWLAEIGARPVREEVEDSGFVYYARHFRSPDGAIPPALGSPLQHYPSLTTLTLPADNGTWGVGLTTSARDARLRKLSDPATWTRVVGSYPLVAHWVDAEPIDDGPATMAKIEDRRRRLVVDGVPVATGLVAVGDSWACTNPSLGRGASIGLMHVQALRDHLSGAPLDDRAGFVRSWDETTEAVVGPWYRCTLEYDRHRLAEMDAQAGGRAYRPSDPGWARAKSLEKAAFLDPELLRAFARVMTVQETPEAVLAQPGVLSAVTEMGAGWENDEAPGPSRDELVSIVEG